MEAIWKTNLHARVARAVALDISDRGAFVRLAGPQPRVGERVRMRLQVPDAHLGANVTGIVRWCGHSVTHDCVGFGIEFERVATFRCAPACHLTGRALAG